MRNLKRLFHLAPILLIAALAPAQTAPSTQPVSAKFLRYVEGDHDDARLESAIVTYRNDAGVVVHVVAAVHVGDKAYYDGLSRTFQHYDALLFEMVKPKDAPVPGPGVRSASAVSGLQRWLKDTLALQFQLDAIDYTAPNFVHADLTYEEFTQLQADRGETILSIMLKAVLDEMARDAADDGSTTRPAAPQPTLTDLIRAMNSPDRPRQLKLILARQFGDIEAAVAGLTGPNGSVLVTERNKAALRVLDETIKSGKKEIGIFYGAAHMGDLSKRLTGEMGFKEVSSEWRVAWDMSPKPINATTRPATRPATQSVRGRAPAPDLSAEEVVEIQLTALQNNDPANDRGIATVFNFASPQNRATTGPLPRFAAMVRSPAYAPMLNFKSAEFTPIETHGDEARQLVKLKATDGTVTAFVFILSRQSDGQYKNCWMTNGVVRVEPAADPAGQKGLHISYYSSCCRYRFSGPSPL